MALPVTTLTAAVLAILFIVLSIRTIGARRSLKISLGDGGSEIVQRRMRGQGNLAEYGPVGLFLVLISELQNVNAMLLVLVSAAFVLGRIMHGYSFSFMEEDFTWRTRGMIFTIWSIVGLVILALIGLFQQLQL